MAFKWETQWNSPNYTDSSRVYATWGRPRTIEAIAIHWWGDPNQNPSYEGIVSYLCRPNGGSSAHIVATGTGRRAACIVDLDDASWATNSANPYTISIECDPRCRPEDYDTVAEVIAQLRSIYGNIPLVPHKQFVATACPGNYDLNRLNQIAATKQVTKDNNWGDVKNKAAPAPTKPTWVPMDNPRHMKAAKDLYVYDLVNKRNVGDVIKKGTDIDFRTKSEWGGKLYLRSKSSSDAKRDWGVLFDSLAELPVVTTKEEKKTQPIPFTKVSRDDATVPVGETKIHTEGVDGVLEITYTVTYTDGKETARKIKSEKVVKEPVQEVTLVGAHESPSEGPVDPETTTLLQDVKKLLQELIQLLKGIFNK